MGIELQLKLGNANIESDTYYLSQRTNHMSMSDLIYNDGTRRIRGPLRAPESTVAQELRLDTSSFLSPRVRWDGFIEHPSLDDWREAERAVRKRLEPNAASEDTHKNTDK